MENIGMLLSINSFLCSGAVGVFKFSVLTLCIAISSLLTGCATNPVTGRFDLSLLDQKEQIELGNSQYKRAIQHQGGAYSVNPAITAYVRDVGFRLVKESHQPDLPFEFTVINSSIPNAWALPGGKIAINRGLILLLKDEAQLAAVLGHEIVHVTAQHSAQSFSKSKAVHISSIALQSIAGDFASVVGAGANISGSLFLAKYNREHELDADFYGTQYISKAGYDPEASIELQTIFLALSKNKTEKKGRMAALFASHPPSTERVEKNTETARNLSGNTRNKLTYSTQMATILKDKAAYAEYDNAVILSQETKFEPAMESIERAIHIQPQESIFWELKGDLHYYQGAKQLSLNCYKQAISLNPTFFQHHLARAILYVDLGQYSEAKTDLIAANKIYTTRMGVFYLGEVAFEQKEIRAALDYYTLLAKSDDKWGNISQQRLDFIAKSYAN
ncbi:MAG: M48 family metalloprotease [Pseudomonadales bacterium]